MVAVNRQTLLSVLQKVKLAVGQKEADIQSTCFVFSEGYVYAYNDDILLSAVLPQELAHLSIAIQAKEFIAYLVKLVDDSIDIDFSTSEGEGLVVKGKRATAVFAVQHKITMPIDEIEEPEKLNKIPSEFIQALKCCWPLAGHDMSKPLSTCVYITQGTMRVTDGSKAGRFLFKNENAFKGQEIYLPATTAKSVCSLSDIKEYGVTSGWLHFYTKDNTVAACRTFYKGQAFVDVDSLMEQTGTPLELPKEIVPALERSHIFIKSFDGTETVAGSEYVDITLSKNKCKISAASHIGKFNEELPMKYSGETVQFQTGVDNLLQIMTADSQCALCQRFVKISQGCFVQIASLKRL